MPASPYFPVEAQGGQGPPPMVQERFQSVITQLFQHVILFNLFNFLRFLFVKFK